MLRKQKIVFVAVLDLLITICAIATLALKGTIFYILESILVISWLITTGYLEKCSKELKQSEAENNDEINSKKDEEYSKSKAKLVKYTVIASLIFAIIITGIVLFALKK